MKGSEYIADPPAKRPHPGTRAFDFYAAMPSKWALNNKYFPSNQVHKIFERIEHRNYDLFLNNLFAKSRGSAKAYRDLLAAKSLVQQREFNTMLVNIIVKQIILFIILPVRFGNSQEFVGQYAYREIIYTLWQEIGKQVQHHGECLIISGAAKEYGFRKGANAREAIKLGAQIFDQFFDIAYDLKPLYVRNRMYRQHRHFDIEDPELFRDAFTDYLNKGSCSAKWYWNEINLNLKSLGFSDL